MLKRILLLITTGLIMMSTTCDKAKCSQALMDKCDFNMKQIEKSPNGKYTAITAKRIYNGKIMSQEVSVYAKGESLNNKCSNVYVTTDTLAPLHLQWTDKGLQIITPGYKSNKTLLREKKVYDVLKVEYADSLKSLQSTVNGPQ